MGSATIFFWLHAPDETKNYRTALIITGIVTTIATYPGRAGLAAKLLLLCLGRLSDTFGHGTAPRQLHLCAVA
jgi:hypothetical protein